MCHLLTNRTLLPHRALCQVRTAGKVVQNLISGEYSHSAS